MPYEMLKTVWTPDLIGPIYKKEITNLREVNFFLGGGEKIKLD